MLRRAGVRRITQAREAVAVIFAGRCFWLFAVLLALIAIVPFIEPTPFGRLAVPVAHVLVIVAAVAAVGRSVGSFVIALLLGGPGIAFHFLSGPAGEPWMIVYSWWFDAALYVVTIAYLLRYVFSPDVMTADKLWGAAAAYLMLGVMWTFVYGLVNAYYGPAFALGGSSAKIGGIDILYFSFTTLTSTGYGDVTPIVPQARALAIVEQVVGTLYLAILIARLAGVYPSSRRGDGAS
jgi:hypothetical protein